MPVQVTKSSMLAKLGGRLQKSHEEHKGDETKFSDFGELPRSGVLRAHEVFGQLYHHCASGHGYGSVGR